jgi:PAS domain S-box-containing protein
LIVSNIKDYAIIGLDPEGRVTSWNGGAQRIKGYRTEEILSKHYPCSIFPKTSRLVNQPTNSTSPENKAVLRMMAGASGGWFAFPVKCGGHDAARR